MLCKFLSVILLAIVVTSSFGQDKPVPDYGRVIMPKAIEAGESQMVNSLR